MLPTGRATQILESKDTAQAQQWCDEHGYSESWAIIDGAVVIFNLDAPPRWMPERDEDGNSMIIEVA